MKKLEIYQVVRKIKEKKINLFTPLEFKRVFGVSDSACQWFIKNHVKKGNFVKIRQGLYMLADYPVDSYLIANRFYEPSYVSFDTALSFYGIIPESIYSIVSATPKITKEAEINNIKFVYHKIKKQAYAGYKPVKIRDNTVLMAEPEKALADYLYFVVLKKRIFSYERLNLKKIKKNKLISYAKLFERSEILKLIKKIYVESRFPKRIY